MRERVVHRLAGRLVAPGRAFAAAGAVAALALLSCARTERAAEPSPNRQALAFQPYAPLASEAPLAEQKIALGRSLFFDPALSADGKVSCSSCHIPEMAFSDTAAVSRGVFGRTGTRNAPMLINVANQRVFFWDGRVHSLEEQVLEPIQNPIEMGRVLDDVIADLNASPEKRAAFRRIYHDDVKVEYLQDALATFLRSLNARPNAYDLDRSGDRPLSTEASRGLALFVGRARCGVCHLGPNLKDDDFHNTGVAVRSGDPGRFAVTGLEAHRGAFRTPNLRNIALTAPYMHDGSLATLEDVVEFYNGGGVPNENLDPLIRPLNLTDQEKRDLVAFLQSLTDVPAPEDEGGHPWLQLRQSGDPYY